MKKEELLEAIGAVGEEYLERSENAGRVRRFPAWQKWAGLAACACLALIVAVPVVTQMIPKMGGSNDGVGSGSNSSDGSSVFMSYAGPVFPMTALSGGEGLTVARDITFDFQPWIPWWDEMGGFYRTGSDIIVEDTYTLTNSDSKEQRVRLCYPFVSSMRKMEQPVLTTKDGTELETQLHMGGYSGGFRTADSSGDSELLLNLEELTGWEQYQELLSDGSYMNHALYYEPDISEIPVVVYRFTQEYGPEPTDKIPSPTIRVMFHRDETATQVLSYGFDGCYWDLQQGITGRQFSIRREYSIDYGEPRFLIILGEDIADIETTCYATGGWDTKKTIADAGVTITREETDLDSILREIVAMEHENVNGYQEAVTVDFETYYRLFVDMLESYGGLSENPVARYEDGMLEFLEVYGVERVCYLETEVVIPPGESITITASMHKEGSFDYYCAHSENRGIYAYDMVTGLGSSFDFTETTAHITNYDGIEIVRQNFGFDPENGITDVILEESREHYYLEVRERSGEEKDER